MRNALEDAGVAPRHIDRIMQQVRFRRLAQALREKPKSLFFASEASILKAQVKPLRFEIAQLEYAEHKERAAQCAMQLVLEEERETWQKELAAVQAWARSQERALKAESAMRLAAKQSAEAAQTGGQGGAA